MPSQTERIEVAAMAIDPWAFSGGMLKLGCGGVWHYTGHSIGSSCGCGSARWDQGWALEQKQADAQEAARRKAKLVLDAVDSLVLDGESR